MRTSVVAGAGRVGRQPVASALAACVRTTLQLPWPSPASGASQALPFDLRWLTSTMKRAPSSVSKAWASEGRLRGKLSPPFTNATLLSAPVVPTGVTAAGR